MDTAKRLWYTKPAAEWIDGLPIGTGRLAAMVLGGVQHERLALNHEWLWRGVNRKRKNRKVADRLPEVRRLLLAGEYAEGTLAGSCAFGAWEEHRCPNRIDSYQPAGDLLLDFVQGPPYGYRRELDLDCGLVKVTYGYPGPTGARVTREAMAHLGLDLMLIRVTATAPDGATRPLTMRIRLDRTPDPDCDLDIKATAEALRMEGRFDGGISFAVGARVFAFGADVQCQADGREILVRDADEIIVAVDAGTSVSGDMDCARLAALETPRWDELLTSQRAEFARHGAEFDLSLPLDEPDRPTDERMRLLREGAADPALTLLYHNYGRYLLVSSSANGSLPANLQGKWNENVDPPWNADYHHDINLQMNYWPAETGGMQESVEALLRHIERFIPHARTAARDLYDCRGVYYPLQTDAWGRSTPESFGWAVWVGAAPWLAQHMWWHYEFSLDEDFLRERAHPFLREVAEFFEDYLIEGENGELLCVPSQSPENRFVGGNHQGAPVSLGINAAMDLELIHDVLTHLVHSCDVLDIDRERQSIWRDMLARLPEPGIGADGRLLEWNEPFEEVEPGHRHMSHLFGLHPGEQFCPFRTPALFRAAEKALEGRMAADGGHTGWSRAWVACLFARLGRGDEAFEHLEHLVSDFASDSLLDLHPPKIFQIEGNLGGVAAIQEMLLQSYHGDMHFLPALPAAWPEGAVRGLRARNGFEVAIRWQGGRLEQAEITSRAGAEARIVDPDGERAVWDAAGKPVMFERHEWFLSFPTERGARYTVK
ncbi:MAG: glycoside hydrolase family 95 protein [Lentisphaeria bacterium]|nr:glycoside hydrolase family 95 protein [Lentisphaeria bacterium]